MRRPWPQSARRGWRRTPRARHAAVWGMIFAGATGTYVVLGPAVDDWRSSLREMTGACTVLRVIDGDTVDLRCLDRGGEAIRARIAGYDAPELFSPRCPEERWAADRSRRALEALVGRAWRTETAFLGTDRYGRTLVDLRLDGVRVATAMVEGGHGVRYLGGLRGGWC